MPASPRKALIFINWNSGPLTVAAARSAFATSKAPEALRVLVVDNGSADDSLAVLARELPEAQVIALPENRGFAKAVNVGLAAVEEDIAFVLNSDIEFQNDAISLLADALQQDPKAALACPKLVRPDGSLQAAAVPHPKVFWELLSRSLQRRLMRLGHDRTVPVPSIVGSCMAVHMRRIESVGFLDERFFFFMEETDWCKRINDAGMRVLYVPAASVMHMQGKSANRRPARARVQFYSSRYRYFRKHAGVLAVAVLYLGMCLRLTVDIVLHGALTVLTLGAARHRRRLAVYARIWLWHMLGCRPKWGFEP